MDTPKTPTTPVGFRATALPAVDAPAPDPRDNLRRLVDLVVDTLRGGLTRSADGRYDVAAQAALRAVVLSQTDPAAAAKPGQEALFEKTAGDALVGFRNAIPAFLGGVHDAVASGAYDPPKTGPTPPAWACESPDGTTSGAFDAAFARLDDAVHSVAVPPKRTDEQVAAWNLASTVYDVAGSLRRRAVHLRDTAARLADATSPSDRDRRADATKQANLLDDTAGRLTASRDSFVEALDAVRRDARPAVNSAADANTAYAQGVASKRHDEAGDPFGRGFDALAAWAALSSLPADAKADDVLNAVLSNVPRSVVDRVVRPLADNLARAAVADVAETLRQADVAVDNGGHLTDRTRALRVAVRAQADRLDALAEPSPGAALDDAQDGRRVVVGFNGPQVVADLHAVKRTLSAFVTANGHRDVVGLRDVEALLSGTCDALGAVAKGVASFRFVRGGFVPGTEPSGTAKGDGCDVAAVGIEDPAARLARQVADVKAVVDAALRGPQIFARDSDRYTEIGRLRDALRDAQARLHPAYLPPKPEASRAVERLVDAAEDAVRQVEALAEGGRDFGLRAVKACADDVAPRIAQAVRDVVSTHADPPPPSTPRPGSLAEALAQPVSPATADGADLDALADRLGVPPRRTRAEMQVTAAKAVVDRALAKSSYTDGVRGEDEISRLRDALRHAQARLSDGYDPDDVDDTLHAPDVSGFDASFVVVGTDAGVYDAVRAGVERFAAAADAAQGEARPDVAPVDLLLRFVEQALTNRAPGSTDAQEAQRLASVLTHVAKMLGKLDVHPEPRPSDAVLTLTHALGETCDTWKGGKRTNALIAAVRRLCLDAERCVLTPAADEGGFDGHAFPPAPTSPAPSSDGVRLACEVSLSQLDAALLPGENADESPAVRLGRLRGTVGAVVAGLRSALSVYPAQADTTPHDVEGDRLGDLLTEVDVAVSALRARAVHTQDAAAANALTKIADDLRSARLDVLAALPAASPQVEDAASRARFDLGTWRGDGVTVGVDVGTPGGGTSAVVVTGPDGPVDPDRVPDLLAAVAEYLNLGRVPVPDRVAGYADLLAAAVERVDVAARAALDRGPLGRWTDPALRAEDVSDAAQVDPRGVDVVALCGILRDLDTFADTEQGSTPAQRALAKAWGSALRKALRTAPDALNPPPQASLHAVGLVADRLQKAHGTAWASLHGEVESCVAMLRDVVRFGRYHAEGFDVKDLGHASKLLTLSDRLGVAAASMKQPGPGEEPARIWRADECADLLAGACETLRDVVFDVYADDAGPSGFDFAGAAASLRGATSRLYALADNLSTAQAVQGAGFTTDSVTREIRADADRVALVSDDVAAGAHLPTALSPLTDSSVDPVQLAALWAEMTTGARDLSSQNGEPVSVRSAVAGSALGHYAARLGALLRIPDPVSPFLPDVDAPAGPVDVAPGYREGGLSGQDGTPPRYVVTKTDGSPTDPDARYFVLRIDGPDPHALAALAKYAESVAEENPTLAADLIAAYDLAVDSPQAAAGLVEARDTLNARDAVVDAFLLPNVAPHVRGQAVRMLRQNWPSLYRAVEALAAAAGAIDAVAAEPPAGDVDVDALAVDAADAAAQVPGEFDTPPDVLDVVRAWIVEGPVPSVHRAAVDALRRDWPTLAVRLDVLAARHRGGR